jgi:drug/metabolite transporter (DMT)-like permease
LVVADGSLLQALLLIGPRLATVIQTLVPVFSTLVAWIWLGERLQWIEAGAVLLTVGGVAWVVSERKQEQAQEAQAASRKQYVLGVLLSVVAALGQSLGLVMTKPVLSAGVPSLSATLIRMVMAMAAMWLLTLIGRQAAATVRALRDRRAFWLIATGAVVGPFLGVWLSLTAVQRAHVGIASTLMGLSPILIIPLSRVFFHEETSARAVVGTVVALAGATAILLA